MTPSNPALSVCMIVKNEAHQLEQALESIRSFADEIIVVDTGSDDDTRTIAQRFTPHVFDFPWCDDFSAARNYSISKAHGEYFLWLDADDRINPENQAKLRRLKSHFDGKKAFYFILQGMDSTGPAESLYQLRCVPRKEGISFRHRIHEELITSVLALDLTPAKVDIVICHEGYKDDDLLAKKVERNLTILEKERAEGRDDEQLHLYLALSYDRLGREEEAIQSMQKAICHLEAVMRGSEGKGRTDLERLPFLMEGFLFLARIYTRRGERNEALRHLARAHAICDENSQTYFRIGCLYQELRNHSQAVLCLRQALQGRSQIGFYPLPPLPPAGNVLVHLAFSLLCLKRCREAMECMERAWALGTDVCKSWEALGLAALNALELPISLQAYEAALQTGSLSPDGYCNLGLLYEKKGLPRKSIECYESSLRKETGHQNALINLAHLHLKMVNNSVAKRLFRESIREGNKDIDVLLAMAKIAAWDKDHSEVKRCGKVLSLQPSLASLAPFLPTGPDFFLALASRLESDNRMNLAMWAREVAAFLR